MAYIYDLTDTWSAGGTVFNAIKMNVTDSASAVASKLVSLQTNGTEHFSVTKAGAGYFSGSVGIGITPLANTRISVRTATVTDTAYYADNGVNSGFKVKFASSLTSILNDFGADLVLGTNDTERMRISAGGNVGIGVTPSAWSGFGLPVLELPSGGTIISAGNGSTIGSNWYYNGSFRYKATAAASYYFQSGGVHSWHSAPSGTAGNAISFTQAMTLDVSGRLLLATTSLSTYVANINGTLGIYGGNGLFLQNGSNNAAAAIYNDGASSVSQIQFSAGGGEKMRIDASGNVGIGTSSPATKLEVSTNTGTEVFKITQTDATGGTVARMRLSHGSGTQAVFEVGSGYGALGLTTSGPLAFITNDTERMRIDSSGNVGIGTSSPASKLDINGALTTGYISVRGDGSEGGQISFSNAANTTSPLNLDVDNLGNGRLFTSINNANLSLGQLVGTGGIVTLSTAAAERMRIDASGNVGIGVTSPSAKLDVNGSIIARTGGSVLTDSVAEYSGGGINLTVGTTGARDLVFRTNNTERARIDSDGNFMVGTTAIGAIGTANGFRARPDGRSLISSATDGVLEVGYNGGNATGTVVGFYKGGTLGGSITTNGSTTAYNTSSDVRLKHDIVDAPEASSLIDAIQVRSFKWNVDDTEQRYGFVAQELVTVAPEAVSQPEDPEEMMGVDYSKLVPMLVKEIQSLRARVAQLEGN